MRLLPLSCALAVVIACWPAPPAGGQDPTASAPSIAPSPGPSRFQWRRLDGPVGVEEQEDGAWLDEHGSWFGSQLAAADGTIVVLGGRHEGREIAAWFSRDGDRWQEANLPGSTPPSLSDVVGLADGFLAVGDGVTWYSADGSTWEPRSTIPGARLQVLATDGDRLVAGGRTGSDAHPEVGVWTSGDEGATWQRISVAEGGTVEAIALSPDGTMVIMGIEATASDLRQVLWVWNDGRARLIDPIGRPTGGRFWQLTGVSWTEAGFVLTATRNRKDGAMGAAMWRSPDGRRWRKAYTTDGAGTAVHAVDGLLLWFGTEVPSDRRRPSGWVATSTDGVTWQRDAFWDDSTVTDVATVGDRTYAIGEFDDLQVTYSGLWVGVRRPDPAEPAPSMSLVDPVAASPMPP